MLALFLCSFRTMYTARTHEIYRGLADVSQLIPSEIKWDPNATPPQYTDNGDQVIEKGTHLRIKLIGTRSDVGSMFARGSEKDDFLGFGFSKVITLSLYSNGSLGHSDHCWGFLSVALAWSTPRDGSKACHFPQISLVQTRTGSLENQDQVASSTVSAQEVVCYVDRAWPWQHHSMGQLGVSRAQTLPEQHV